MKPEHHPSRRRGRLFLALLATLVVIGAVVQSLASPGKVPAGAPAPGPGTTNVSIQPTSSNATTGANVSVEVAVANVTGLAAYEFEIHYFGSTLGLVSATNGPFLGGTGRMVTCLPPQLDVGKVRFGCVTLGEGAGVQGSGVLATVTFSTSCTGQSPLDLALVGLSTSLGDAIPTSSQGGQATVQGGASVCPTPTPTLRPTSTPTATRTPSPTPVGLTGDANCDHTVNSVDAAIDLQYSAGLAASLPCLQTADANHDRTVNALDAALVLQFVAGLLTHL